MADGKQKPIQMLPGINNCQWCNIFIYYWKGILFYRHLLRTRTGRIELRTTWHKALFFCQRESFTRNNTPIKLDYTDQNETKRKSQRKQSSVGLCKAMFCLIVGWAGVRSCENVSNNQVVLVTDPDWVSLTLHCVTPNTHRIKYKAFSLCWHLLSIF